MEDDDVDARGLEEQTPLPRFGPIVSSLQADYDVALATVNQLRLANSTLQAKLDEYAADRRALAQRVRQLEQLLKEKK